MGKPESMKSPSIALPVAMPDLSQFMTTRQAAKKLGFNVRSIPYMVKNKTLDGVRVGHLWLVSQKSVRDYLRKTRGFSKNDPRR
jgi:excisionase family DNA binding protein